MAILRVGCYERVSTDEQALRGFSIEAQIDNLTEYCEENNLKLVGHYTDAGKSGTLPPLKRPELQRLLEDVQAGKIDIILFTKLDRWFRSVKEYLTRIRLQIARQNVKQRAFSASAFAHDGNEFSFLNLQIHSVQDLSVAVLFADVYSLDHVVRLLS